MAACCSLKARSVSFAPNGNGNGSAMETAYNSSFDAVNFYSSDEPAGDGISSINDFVLGAANHGAPVQNKGHYLGTITAAGTSAFENGASIAESGAANSTSCTGTYCPPANLTPAKPNIRPIPLYPAKMPYSDWLLAGVSAAAGATAIAVCAFAPGSCSPALTGALAVGAAIALFFAWRADTKYDFGAHKTRVDTVRWIAVICTLGAMVAFVCSLGMRSGYSVQSYEVAAAPVADVGSDEYYEV